MEDMKKLTQVYSILFLGVIGISFSAIFIRYTTAPSSIIAMYRMGMTCLLLLPMVIWQGWDEIKKIQKREYFFCGLGGFFLALHFYTWITSLDYTTVASSTMIVSLQPIFTVGIAYFIFKEKINTKSFVGMTIAIGGSVLMGLINYQAGGGSWLGDGLAFAGAFFGALYIIIGRGMRKNISIITYGFLVYGACTITLIFINLVTKTPFTEYPTKDYFLFLAMAVVCTIGGHTIFNWGLKYVEANKISTFMLGEPVGASIWAILLLREIPTGGQIISGGVILLGLYIFMNASIRGKEKEIVTQETLPT